MHIDQLAREAAAGADKAGGKAIIFGTITISDGISMGTPGMRYSLVSREVIADSIETVSGAEGFDAVVAIGGCDKNMPGCLMALARSQPAFPSSSTAVRSLPGIHPGTKHECDIVSVFEAVGKHANKTLDDAGLKEVEVVLNPRPWFLWRHVHGQYDGFGNRSDGDEPAEQFLAACHWSGEKRRLPESGCGGPCPT